MRGSPFLRRDLLRAALGLVPGGWAGGCTGTPAASPCPEPPKPEAPPARRGLAAALGAAHAELGPRGIIVAGFDARSIRFNHAFGSALPDRDEPFTLETCMPVASVSKMLTGVAVSTLVRDARLGWDDRLSVAAPSIKLHPSYGEDRPTVRDVLAHRTGLPMWAGDMLWYRSAIGWPLVRSRVEHMAPTAPIRSAFSYSNILVTALREAFEVRAGRSWEDAIRKEILTPAGMTRTVLRDADDVADPRAVPITTIDGAPAPAAPLLLDTIAPAGGVRSCAADLVRFGQLMLRRGEESSPLPAAILDSMWEPHLSLPLSLQRRRITPETLTLGTALGCFFMLHAGRRLVYHGGALPGVSALLLLAPEDGCGLTLLANADDDVLMRVMTFTALDDLLGLEPSDWLGRFKEIAAGAQGPARAEPRTTALTPADEKALAGSYRSKVYGSATIAPEEGGLRLRLEHHPSVVGVVERRVGNGYLVAMQPKHLGPMPIAVARKKDGVIAFECQFGPEYIDGLVYRFERA